MVCLVVAKPSTTAWKVASSRAARLVIRPSTRSAATTADSEVLRAARAASAFSALREVSSPSAVARASARVSFFASSAVRSSLTSAKLRIADV
ncbi:hypothetical protein D3C75_849930 [compost metagenome]